jgi:hypothetical protein
LVGYVESAGLALAFFLVVVVQIDGLLFFDFFSFFKFAAEGASFVETASCTCFSTFGATRFGSRNLSALAAQVFAFEIVAKCYTAECRTLVHATCDTCFASFSTAFFRPFGVATLATENGYGVFAVCVFVTCVIVTCVIVTCVIVTVVFVGRSVIRGGVTFGRRAAPCDEGRQCDER